MRKTYVQETLLFVVAKAWPEKGSENKVCYFHLCKIKNKKYQNLKGPFQILLLGVAYV